MRKKNEAVKMRDLIRTFLTSLHLELSMEKTLITNARAERAKFLGIYIKRLAANKGSPNYIRIGEGTMKRAPTGNL
jgi:hypothetical protein